MIKDFEINVLIGVFGRRALIRGLLEGFGGGLGACIIAPREFPNDQCATAMNVTIIGTVYNVIVVVVVDT